LTRLELLMKTPVLWTRTVAGPVVGQRSVVLDAEKQKEGCTFQGKKLQIRLYGIVVPTQPGFGLAAGSDAGGFVAAAWALEMGLARGYYD